MQPVLRRGAQQFGLIECHGGRPQRAAARVEDGVGAVIGRRQHGARVGGQQLKRWDGEEQLPVCGQRQRLAEIAGFGFSGYRKTAEHRRGYVVGVALESRCQLKHAFTSEAAAQKGVRQRRPRDERRRR